MVTETLIMIIFTQNKFDLGQIKKNTKKIYNEESDYTRKESVRLKNQLNHLSRPKSQNKYHPLSNKNLFFNDCNSTTYNENCNGSEILNKTLESDLQEQSVDSVKEYNKFDFQNCFSTNIKIQQNKSNYDLSSVNLHDQNASMFYKSKKKSNCITCINSNKILEHALNNREDSKVSLRVKKQINQ